MRGALLVIFLILGLLVLINSSVVAILFYLLLALIIGFAITKFAQSRWPAH